MRNLTSILLATLIFFGVMTPRTGYCAYPNFPTAAEQSRVTLPLKTPYRLWYSPKQALVGGIYWGKLKNGKLVLYTEATLTGRSYTSNFDDAKYQGVGDFVKRVASRYQGR